LQRDTELGLNFAPVVFYDGQGFMVTKKSGVKSAKELNGATICVAPGTTTELNLADFFRSNNMKYEVIAFGTADETVKAYESGRCDVFTSDVVIRQKEPKRNDQRSRDDVDRHCPGNCCFRTRCRHNVRR